MKLMRGTVAISVAVVLCATVALDAAVKKYGKPLTVKDTTKVSDIFAQPDTYNGKIVKVQGPIVDVCSMKGCWIAIGSDKEFQSIRFKVDDGVIVFPMDAKGSTATVEGTVTITTVSEEEQIKHGEEMAKEKKAVFDRKTVKGPRTEVQIKGDGAEIF
jgi:hypothetical protein